MYYFFKYSMATFKTGEKQENYILLFLDAGWYNHKYAQKKATSLEKCTSEFITEWHIFYRLVAWFV